MSEPIAAFREHLVRLLDWEDAHVSFDTAVEGLQADLRGRVPPGFDRSAWQLVEHIRIAQEDILDFCVNAQYEHTRAWPDDYWPEDPAPPGEQAWTDSLAAYGRARDGMRRLAREIGDLTALVPTGSGTQTYLRAILLSADHAAYHVGQILAVRRALGAWPH